MRFFLNINKYKVIITIGINNNNKWYNSTTYLITLIVLIVIILPITLTMYLLMIRFYDI